MRRTISLTLLLLLAGAGILAPQDPQGAQQAPPQTAPQQAAPVPVGSLSLQGASLEQVIDQLARQLRLNYIVDAPIAGTVTMNTYGDPGNLDARNLLELLLRINDLGLVQDGDLYRIVQLPQTRRLPVSRITDPSDIVEDDRLMLNLVFLKYITVDTISSLLAEFTDERTIIRSYEPANLLLVLDSRRNMRRLMELVDMFDSDTFAGERIQQFDIENVLPSQLQKDLESVLRSLSLDGQTATVRFLPVDRIGLLIAIAPNPGVFKTVAEWVAKLDTPITITSGVLDTYVYRVRYGRADCLALALNQLYNPGMAYNMGGMYGGGGGFVNQNPYNGFGGGYGPYGGWNNGGYGGYNGASASGYGSGNSFNSQFGGSGGCGPYSGMGGGMGGYGGYGGGGYPSFGGYTAQVPVNTQQGSALAGGMIGGGASAPAPNAAGGQAQNQNGGAAPGPNPPRIVPNPLDNALLIQATKEQYQAILKLLRDLDVPPRQILLQAKIYSLTLNNSLATGIQALLRPRTNTDRRLTGTFAGGLAILEAGTLVGQSRELMAAVAAQEIAGNARVISEPSLIATDSVPAMINVGAQVPVLTGQTATPVQVGGTNAFTQGISSHNTGVTMQVNARVNPSGVVTLIINQEVSEPTATTTSDIPTPSFNQQVVQTQITLQDGDTIAIGGTISENTSNASAGLPGLSRLPILGHLFGSRQYTRDRNELIIFMTPHVIYDTTDLLEASEEVRSRMRRLQRYIP